jgi:hypothetical protein
LNTDKYRLYPLGFDIHLPLPPLHILYPANHLLGT